jgi:hypothetical protein
MPDIDRLKELDAEKLKAAIIAYMSQAYALDTDTAVSEIIAWVEQGVV